MNSILPNTRIILTLRNRAIGLILLLGAALIMSPDANATVGGPVVASISSGNELRPGTAMTVYVVVEALRDTESTSFQLLVPREHWRLDGEPLHWSGPMRAGQVIQRTVSVTPISDRVEPLRVIVEDPLAGASTFVMDITRLGGRFPELTSAAQVISTSPVPPPLLRPGWERSLPLPTPEPPRQPRVPGQTAKLSNSVLTAGTETREASSQVTVTGQFVFMDDQARPIAVRHATVELLDWDPPFLPQSCASPVLTDIDGNFSISGSCRRSFRRPARLFRSPLVKLEYRRSKAE